MKILIVDDESAYRTLLAEILSRDGYEVVAAEDGRQALAKLEEARIDFIISDVYMPGMDGVEFHRAVRSDPRFEQLPFLFVTGFNDNYTQGSAKDPLKDGLLPKGGPADEIKQWIKYLSSPVAERGRYKPLRTNPSR